MVDYDLYSSLRVRFVGVFPSWSRGSLWKLSTLSDRNGNWHKIQLSSKVKKMLYSSVETWWYMV